MNSFPFAVWMAGMAVALLGCREGTGLAPSQPVGAASVTKERNIPMTLKPQTFETLLAFTNRALAIVRCEGTELRDRGSRSEQVWIDATVVQSGLGDLPVKWRLRCFTQGDPKMTRSFTYLVAAFEDSPEDWYMEECLEVAPDRATETLNAVLEAFRQKVAGKSGQP